MSSESPAGECVLVRSDEYKKYKSSVALKRMDFVTKSGQRKVWRYTDFSSEGNDMALKQSDTDDSGNPVKKVEEEGPLVMLGGVCCTPETFYKQFRGLCPRGHRLIAVQLSGDFANINDWIDAFRCFLDNLNARRIHLFGSQLGGYLAMRFVSAYPSRIWSLILCNAFCDTEPFITRSPFFSMLPSWMMPDIVVKRWALAQLPSEKLSVAVADSVDFVVHEIEQTEGEDLLSKAKLILEPGVVNPFPPNHPLLTRGGGKCVTVMMSEDAHSGSNQLREEVLKYFPDARLTVIRNGGDFPYLSSGDEVNMFIEVHLRFAEGIARNGDPKKDEDESEDAQDSAVSAAAAVPEPKSAWD